MIRVHIEMTDELKLKLEDAAKMLSEHRKSMLASAAARLEADAPPYQPGRVDWKKLSKRQRQRIERIKRKGMNE